MWESFSLQVQAPHQVNAKTQGNKKYKLVKKYIPIFISKELAKKIYKIGRTLNFIRVCCKDHDYVARDVQFEYESMSFSQMHELEQKVFELSQVTNHRLMNLMMNKFKFMMHASAMRKYLLLGQGDFIQQLLADLRKDLDKHATGVKAHDIQNKLESAIINSNAQFDDNDVKARLKVKILPVK